MRGRDTGRRAFRRRRDWRQSSEEIQSGDGGAGNLRDGRDAAIRKNRKAGLSSGLSALKQVSTFQFREQMLTAAAPQTYALLTHRTLHFCTVNAINLTERGLPTSHQYW